jgi:tetratricopeptide (TPR) repeat protein
VRRGRPLAALLGLVAALAAVAPAAHAVAPRTVELPVPELPLAVTPLSLGLVRPPLEPPAPPPPAAPTVELRVPLPLRFQTLTTKDWPPASDPGVTSCFVLGLAGPARLLDCGVHRVRQGDASGAREAFQEILDRRDRSPETAVAHVWLGEIAFQQGRYDEAERQYRFALPLNPPAELAAHARLGLAWTTLRRGDLGEAQRALAGALAGTPPPRVALFARFLDGVARLQAGRPQEALAQWDAVAAAGPPSQLAEELWFWRGAALAQLHQADAALRALDGFLGATPAAHPLRPDAVVQSGWVALLRGAPDDALRRFLWAQGSSLRPELIPQLRAGLVRAYLAVGDSARARDMARALKGESPRDPLVPAVLLLLADDAGRRAATAEAVDLYRELIGVALDPAYGEYAMYRLAEGLERLGSLTDAEKSYRALRDGGRVEALAQRAAYRLGLLALRAQRPGDSRAEGEMLLRAGLVPELREAAILLAAESAARADDANRAVALFRLALREYPASSRAGAVRLALGWALLKDREPELALREWHEAALANEVEVAVQANLAIAQVALRQGREPESLAALRQVTVLAPRHPLSDVLALNRGLLLVRGKDYAGAVQELQPLTRIVQPFRLSAPGGMVVDLEPILRRALGIARYHLAQFDLAERDFERARQLAPAELSSHLGEGLAALAQSRFAQADRALNIARHAAVPDIAVPATYALVLSADGRRDGDLFRERATVFVDRYAAHPYTELLLYRLVHQAVERRELERAEAWTRRLVRDQPASALITDAWLLVAEAAARDRPALARQAYGELLARVRDPEARSAAWLGLAEAASGLRDLPEAQRALEGFLAEAPPQHPRAAEALLKLVQAYDVQGQRDRTLAMTDTFLARYPQHAAVPDIQLRRGYLLLITQQWDAARQALEAAREAGEPVVAAAAHVYLGQLHLSRGEHEPALSEYLAAAYVYPDAAPWAARGLQGAIQTYLTLQMPREALGLLRKLQGRPALEPEVAQWARDRLTKLGPITGEDPAQVLRKGASRQ